MPVQPEQDLPGNPALGSEELPEGQKLSAKAPVHGEKPDATAIELPTRISTSVDSPAPTVTAVAPASSSGIDSRVLESTHDIVALHAMRLNETGSDSLRVVVKPGDGIQLSLELRQSARGIEVSAELHKGDFQQLNQHWSDLQQRLEARGVRVGTLTTAENYTGAHQQFNQSKQQSTNQDSLQAGAFAEFALSGSVTRSARSPTPLTPFYRGWEAPGHNLPLDFPTINGSYTSSPIQQTFRQQQHPRPHADVVAAWDFLQLLSSRR